MCKQYGKRVKSHYGVEIMIYQNIDKMQNAEAIKDEFFKNTIGFGRSEDITHEESFMACHRFRDVYKQPAIFDSALLRIHCTFLTKLNGITIRPTLLTR